MIANSNATAETFVATGGRRALVEVVYNGFEPSDFVRPSHFSQTALRKKLELPDGLLIAIFGRLTRWKGQHIALEALLRCPACTSQSWARRSSPRKIARIAKNYAARPKSPACKGVCIFSDSGPT